ncbi:DNA cytosine methyltransferase [Nocardiopsis alba]|uniref:DNA (cytosine-5-)-methyltransferase n=1 Tax=Nocardiopsis alba TaxID=53437 RepID=A0A7K2IL27_9ACTN|nr:DNA cytosine methyltransferase [Nocardiopsis alba]MYR30690.1 DNA cytosine methyltransferase [Nocardiopsis alba]MYR30760.1 DNA cytosine methyltransferase [Nocardiopsis alba]
MTVTISDFFCGAGGSSTGAAQVPGVSVAIAANHWKLAVDTHQANHPNALHDVADLSQVDPRRYPTTDIAWFSPSCTHHSRAARKRVSPQPDLFGTQLVDIDAERSRATMWDVVRFAEHHRYQRIVVENVLEVRSWVLWPAWTSALSALRYEWTFVSMNAAFATALGHGAATTRDRGFVLAWPQGATPPNVGRWTRPTATCPEHGTISAVQAFKAAEVRAGAYGEQYVWRCPRTECRNVEVHPEVAVADDIIDRTVPAMRIGNRRPGTRSRPLVERTRARLERGLNRYARRDGDAFVVEDLVSPYYGTATPRPASRPLPTITTRDRHGLLIGGRYGSLDDLSYRMFTAAEYARAMGFPKEYVLLGEREDQVRQVGNAVSPPVGRDLVGCQVEALTGERIDRVPAAAAVA